MTVVRLAECSVEYWGVSWAVTTAEYWVEGSAEQMADDSVDCWAASSAD